MQLISCLQCRRCPHYFLPAVDLFRGRTFNPSVVILWSYNLKPHKSICTYLIYSHHCDCQSHCHFVAVTILSFPISCKQGWPLIKTFFNIVYFQANLPPRLTTPQNLLGGFWGSCLPMAKLSKISENLFDNLENLWRNQIYSRGDQSPVTQKVQLASIFFLGLQAYSFDFRSCTLSLEEFLKVSCGYPGSSRKYLNLLFWHFFARKCNTCDHLNCYNLPLNMHQVFDLSKRHLPNISCCFIYHLICL